MVEILQVRAAAHQYMLVIVEDGSASGVVETRRSATEFASRLENDGAIAGLSELNRSRKAGQATADD